jgi:hypothetical protein
MPAAAAGSSVPAPMKQGKQQNSTLLRKPLVFAPCNPSSFF